MALLIFDQSDTSSGSAIVATTIIVLVVSLALRSRIARVKGLRRLADSRRFAWLDSDVPNDFPTDVAVEMAPHFIFPRATTVGNTIAGWQGNDFLLAFDMHLGSGRNQFRQTVVAIRSKNHGSDPKLAPPLSYRRSGDWRILVRRPPILGWSILKPSTIEQYWSILDQPNPS